MGNSNDPLNVCDEHSGVVPRNEVGDEFWSAKTSRLKHPGQIVLMQLIEAAEEPTHSRIVGRAYFANDHDHQVLPR
jgi:hypothetical protein